MNISEDTLQGLQCANCNLPLSVGPVTINPTYSFVCGRCLNEGAPVNTIYEALAQQFVFPCRYQSEGCKDTIQWGFVVEHEENCPKKPVNCPATLPCAWRGTVSNIASHFMIMHDKDFISETNKVEISLDEDGRFSKVIRTRGKDYILEVNISKEEKLLLNIHQLIDLSEFEFKKHQYKLKFYIDDSKHLTLKPVDVEPYRPFNSSNVKNNVVDVSVLKLLNEAASSVFCEIIVDLFDFKKLLTLLECTGCKQFMSTPIYNTCCKHDFCGPCIASLSGCPVCLKGFGLFTIPDHSLEALVTKVNEICKNKEL